MVQRFAVFFLAAFVVIVVAGLVVAVVPSFTPVSEVAAATEPVAVAAAREPIQTMCRSNGAQMELCISSDNRGLFSVFDGVQTSRYVYFFYDQPGECPDQMPGYRIRVADWSLTELQFFGFDPNDFTGLGVGSYYCTFAPVS